MNTQTAIELLAPAGSMPAFYAAIHNGADAVYLGAAAFGARAGAGFEDEDLLRAVRYAHLYRKKVYVTLNTLIKQKELPQLSQSLTFLDAAQIDAVIVQDLGLMRLIRRQFPHLSVHASTQMSVHSAAGAALMKRLGLTRVVLARECGLETIREASAQGIEIEVFVHGAQCVSVSGQCLLSSHIGGRSGNRGRCAQPCRTSFLYRGAEGAWLSPRDLAQIDHIGDLARAGVSSLKIEGRLKRPEYVATVTRQYRQAIDRYMQGQELQSKPADRKALLQIFNRGGFTQGWAFGQSDARQINPLRVSHEGIPLGAVKSTERRNGFYLSEVSLSEALRSGDHLQIRGSEEQEMIYSGPECGAGAVAVLRHHQPARPGDLVYKLTDARQIEQAQQSYERPMPPIALDACLVVEPGVPASLSLWSGDIRITVQGEAPQAALSRPMDRESSLKAIQKTGDSPFSIASFAFEAKAPCFMPVSALNALRRDALEQMKTLYIASNRRLSAPPPASFFFQKRKNQETVPSSALYVRSSRIDLLDVFRASGMDCFLYSPQDYTGDGLRNACQNLGKQDYFCLPRQAGDSTLHRLKEIIEECRLSVVADNIGQLHESYPGSVLAGAGIPCWNGETAGYLADAGCDAVILSTELSKQELESLGAASPLPGILPVYGRAAVMQLNHCPERTFRGLSGSQTGCQLCRMGQGSLGQHLEDRMGARFPLSPVRLPEGCLNTLLFHTPLNLQSKAIGTRWLLDFTTEDEETMLALIRAYAALKNGGAQKDENPLPLYAGRFDEGVL